MAKEVPGFRRGVRREFLWDAGKKALVLNYKTLEVLGQKKNQLILTSMVPPLMLVSDTAMKFRVGLECLWSTLIQEEHAVELWRK